MNPHGQLRDSWEIPRVQVLRKQSAAHLEGASEVDVCAVLALLELEHLGLLRGARMHFRQSCSPLPLLRSPAEQPRVRGRRMHLWEKVVHLVGWPDMRVELRRGESHA